MTQENQELLQTNPRLLNPFSAQIKLIKKTASQGFMFLASFQSS
jgi:hypothetical protein